MKYSGFLVGGVMAAVANAHTTIWNMYVDDVDQGVGNVAGGYIRYPPNNNPVKDITSADMTCNVANTANTLTKSVAAGSKVSFEWHHDTNSASDDIIAASHKGPVIVYIAPTSSNGAGDVWVKIAEDGYDATTKTWAVDTLIANKGIHSFTLPAALADGDYLLRGEIIALHEADAAYSANSARGAQFYMECVQVTVTGGGSTALPAGVAIPGAYTDADPGVVFNLYGSFTEYTIPGPALWTEAGGDASSGTTTPAASSAAAPAASSSAVVASSAAAEPTVVASSAAAPAVTSAPATAEEVPATTAAPVVSSAKSSKSACKAKTSSVAPQVAVVTSAPAASATKSACSKKPTTLQTIVKSSAVAGISMPAAVGTGSSPASTGGASTGGSTSSGSVALYGQCGGSSYTGATTCASGTCTEMNSYYSQCI